VYTLHGSVYPFFCLSLSDFHRWLFKGDRHNERGRKISTVNLWCAWEVTFNDGNNRNSRLCAKLGGCHASGRPKDTGEGAVIVEAAGVCDLGHGLIRVAKHARGGRDPRFGDELAGRQTEESFGQSSPSLRRQFGAVGEPRGCDIGREALFEFFEGTREVLGNFVRLDRHADITRETDQANDGACGGGRRNTPWPLHTNAEGRHRRGWR